MIELKANFSHKGILHIFIICLPYIQTMNFISSIFIPLILMTGIASCNSTPQKGRGKNGAFSNSQQTNTINVDKIINSGELIMGTISGPDTYFDYQGVGLGLQYALAEDYANTLGVSVRVELSNDTTDLVKKLNNGEIDIIALQLPDSYCKRYHLAKAGAHDTSNNTYWAVKNEAQDLVESLNDWYGNGVEISVEKKEKQRMTARHEVKRTIRAPYISREKNIISIYDKYFKEAAYYTGWDWKLIAAQCYQESGFDPNAISWAGAKGLMQIMPNTAKQLNLAENDMFRPMENIAAAARLIKDLQNKFSYISDTEERIKFILASYNGGTGHINDAQSLTKKYGGNSNSWLDVSYYIKNLNNPRYYRDPVVKYGYMIGSETYNYVENIMLRWKQYGGDVRNISSPSYSVFHSSHENINSKSEGRRPHKKNRFSKEQKILTPKDFQNGHKANPL